MKIATFNVNNITRRLPNLIAWLEAEAPDVACLQEIKVTDEAFPAAALEKAGYGAAWKGQRQWHGVAILARGAQPVVTRRALPGDPADTEPRYLEAAIAGVLVASIYLPNGNPQPGPKFDYKLAWFDRLIAHAQALYDTGAPVVLAGDFNVVPTDADIYSPRSWLKNALLQPAPRAAWRRLLAQGWTDALAATHPNGPPWTFWPYIRDAWGRDAGWRIDHLLVGQGLTVHAAGVDRWVRGEADASDHAPTWVEVRKWRSAAPSW